MNGGLTWSSGYGCVKEEAHRRNGIGVEATGRGNYMCVCRGDVFSPPSWFAPHLRASIAA